MAQKPILVVKIGGSIASKAQNLAAELATCGQQAVLVHGGGPQASALSLATNNPPRYLMSPEGFKSRYTDAKTMENFVMAVGGGVNSSLVQLLCSKGAKAIGISGASAIIRAKRKTLRAVENGREKIIRDDYSGKIISVDAAPLRLLLDNGYLPVVAPIALGEEFEALNVDGDRAAAAIANALGAKTLLLFTDVEGFYTNFPNGLLKAATSAQIPGLQKSATGGMKRKLVAAQEALGGSVEKVVIASGIIASPITSALAGNGTHFAK